MIDPWLFVEGKKRKRNPCPCSSEEENEKDFSTDEDVDESDLNEEVLSAGQEQELYEPERDAEKDSKSDLDSEDETEKFVYNRFKYNFLEKLVFTSLIFTLFILPSQLASWPSQGLNLGPFQNKWCNISLV